MVVGPALVRPPVSAAKPTDPLQTETVWIPVVEKPLIGRARELKLETTVFRAAGSGPSRVLIFNHGSTGRGRSSPKETVTYPATARFFVERGFTVVIPMRRGRGESDGEYLERYECDAATLAGGVDRAIEDLDAVMTFVARQPWFDPAQLLLGGMSRGGLLSIVYASTRATSARGVVNLAGGWVAEGCDRTIGFHAKTLSEAGRAAARRGAKLPMLWLYSQNDRNYGPAAVQAFHGAFVAAGGTADLQIYPPIGHDGHILLPRHPDVWGGDVDQFLGRIGFETR